MVGARNFPSLMSKLPLIPSRCRSSSTNVPNCLHEDIFSAVISASFLSLMPLFALISAKYLLIDSISIVSAGSV